MTENEEDPVRQYLSRIGKKGGKAKGKPKGYATLSEEERKASARKGAEARWGKKAGAKKKATKKKA